MTLTKGNLILTISQAWLLLLLEKSKMYTQSCAQEHANIIMVSFMLLKYINFCSRWYYIDDEVCISQLLRLSEYDDKWFGHYQLSKKMKRAHKKYCLIVFYRAVIFSAAVFKVTVFFFISKQIYLYDCKEFQSLRKCIAFCYPFSEETAHIM